MHVDLMEGSPEIVERVIASAGRARARRRRHRALTGAFAVTAAVGAIVGVVAVSNHDRSGLTVTAGPSTSAATTAPRSPLLSPSAFVRQWDPQCGTAPQL